MMDELGFLRIELQNHIDGLEISKMTGCWSDDDERHLQLDKRIMDLLKRIEVKKNDTNDD